MGMPIAWRLSEEALRKRQLRRLSLTIPLSSRSNQYRHHPFPASPRVSGLNRDALADMRAYFDRDDEDPNPNPNPNPPPRKGRLTLVRTFLPSAARAHRSSSLILEQGLAQFLSSDSESDDILVRVRRRFRSRRGRTGTPRTTAPETVLSDSDRESVDPPVSTPPPRHPHLPLTYSAVSMLFTEQGDPRTTKVWEIGCWAGTHQLAAGDMLHLYIDVLAEVATIPSCQVDELCIGDSLGECSAVIEGINLLKEVSAELHASYDKNSDYFIHPMTDRPVQIVLRR